MKSRFRIGGRALHRLLVPVPLALLASTFAADLVGTMLDLPALWIAAWYLGVAGVVAGVVAALAGALDYATLLARRAGGAGRATLHLLVNGTALLLFAAAWYVRGAVSIPPDPAILLIQGIATALLLVGIWLGRGLVRRHGIGADRPTGHRRPAALP